MSAKVKNMMNFNKNTDLRQYFILTNIKVMV